MCFLTVFIPTECVFETRVRKRERWPIYYTQTFWPCPQHCSGHREEQLRKQQGTFISDPCPLSPFPLFASFLHLSIRRHPPLNSLSPMSSCFCPSLPSSLHFLYPDLCPSRLSAWHFNHHIRRTYRITKPHPSQLAIRAESFHVCARQCCISSYGRWAPE